MKSGMAAMVSAAIAVKARTDEGQPLLGDLILAFTGGENSSCLGARRLVETGALAGAEAALFSEPSSLAVVSAECSALWLEVSSEAGGGSDPIAAMVQFLSSLDEVLPQDEHPLLGRASGRVGTIGGGEFISRPAAACRAQLDLRLLPNHDPDQVEAALTAAGGATVKLSRLDFKPAVETPADHPFLRVCLEETAIARGEPSGPIGQPFFSDACVLCPGFGMEFAIIGPGTVGGSGAVDESCSIEDIVSAASIYERIALRRLT